MFVIKKLVATLVMPYPLTLALLITAGVLFWLGRRRWAGGIAVSGVMVLLLAAWAPVADGLLGALERRHPVVLDASAYPEARHVVVLGSGYVRDRSLPITSQLVDSGVIRVAEGVRLYRQMANGRLVVTGGSAFSDWHPADGYAELALALGVPEADLLVLNEPRDTAEEARAVAALIGHGEPFLLVTSASHMARSMIHFRRAGLDPLAAPTRHKSLRANRSDPAYWVPNASHLRKTERALYEYMGLFAAGGQRTDDGGPRAD